MAEKNNATCSICGKSYHTCLSCKDLITLSPWKIHTDTSEHYKIYQILHGYSTGVYSKDEAKSKLQMVDLSDLDSFREHIKSVIKDILLKDTEIENIDISVDINNDEIETEIVSENVKTTRKKKSVKVVETE